MAGVSVAPERAPGQLALRPRMVRTLFWLRWRLMARRLGSSVGAIIGLVFAILFYLLIGGSLGAATAAGYSFLPHDQAATLLFLVAAGIYVIWAILPLLQYSLNEGLDVTKLVLYPLTRLELMASLIISVVFDASTLLLVLLFAGVVVGFANDWSQALAMSGVMVLALIHTVVISQLLLAALMGLLRSRRYRDLSIVLGTLLVLSFSLSSQIIARTAGSGRVTVNIFQQILSSDVGKVLQFVPPGMAARAVTAIAGGDVVGAVAWSFILLVALVPVVWAWSAILERGLASPEQAAARRGRRVGRAAPGAAPSPAAPLAPATISPATISRRGAWSFIPAPALAMAGKELLYYWRDPQYKRLFLGSLYFVGIVLISIFGVSAHSLRGNTQLVVLAPIFLTQSLTTSIFGYEAAAMTTLAIFPVRGAHILLGKNLAALMLGVTEAAILLTLQGAVSSNWSTVLPYGVAVVAAMLASLGTGDVLAVLFPLRVARTALGRNQLDSGTNFVTFLLNGAAYLVSLALIIPIALAIILPQVLGHREWLLATLPGALLYGAGLYAAGLAVAASLYYPRLTAIMKVVVKE